MADRLSKTHNEFWIQKMIKEGAEIIDIGPDFIKRASGMNPSEWYAIERRLSKGYNGYRKVFERFSKTTGGVPGIDEIF